MAKNLSGKTPLKFIEYAFVRVLLGFLRLFPYKVRMVYAEKFGSLVYKIASSSRRLVMKHISDSFPGKSPEWVEEITKKNFLYMGRLLAQIAQESDFHAGFASEWMKYSPDKETIRDMLKDGGIMVMPHMGCWEWLGSSTSQLCNDKLVALAKRQSNPWSNAFMEKTRRDAHFGVLYTDQNPKSVLRHVKNKGIALFVSDQHAGGAGEIMPFIGRLASVFRGPAYFARLCDAPVFFAWGYHDEDRKLNLCIMKMPIPSRDPKKDPDGWEKEFTRIWVGLMEEKILEHPIDYFWVHKRWKVKPENPNSIFEYWKNFDSVKN